MRGWAEDLLQAVENVDDEQALFARVEHAARALGFEHCAYGIRIPLPVTRPRFFLVNNYPLAWQARYAEAGYLDTDPTVRHGRRSQQPIVWNEHVFAATPELWHEAQAAGLKVGWAQSSLDGHGVGGMLTLARSAEDLSDKELQANEVKMRWLVNIAHLAFTRVLAPRFKTELLTPLTARETEVLKWAADGKTTNEISTILTISVDTVKFHTKNAITKLCAANKTAAVARAAMLGLLN